MSTTNGRVNFARVVKSETIKLFTLRSTWWTLVIAAVITIGFGVLTGYSHYNLVRIAGGIDPGSIPPQVFKASDVITSTSAIYLEQLVICVLAVLAVTNDYSSGQMRSTLVAVPTRTPVLATKALIVAIVAFVASFVTEFLAMLAGWPFLAGYASGRLSVPSGWSVTDDRFNPATIHALLGIALATVCMAVFALAVGALLRNTAAGIAVVFVVVLLLPSIAGAFSWHWATAAASYLLTPALQGLYVTAGAAFGFAKSLVVGILWAAVPTVAAGILLKRRDA